MTADSRLSILRAYPTLPPDQRSRKIHQLDIIEAAITFGIALAVQLQRDQFTGYKCWDSFSMILQSETLLPTELEVQRFKDWAFRQLQVKWCSDYHGD